MDGPTPSSETARKRMIAQSRRDTAPELALRRRLHGAGLRYRVDVAPVAGLRRKADIVFTRPKVAVYVDGCFWHRCPMHGTAPAANADWWRAKLDGNVARDRDTDRRLAEAGWVVVRVWEHEDSFRAAARVRAALKAAQR